MTAGDEYVEVGEGAQRRFGVGAVGQDGTLEDDGGKFDEHAVEAGSARLRAARHGWLPIRAGGGDGACWARRADQAHRAGPAEKAGEAVAGDRVEVIAPAVGGERPGAGKPRGGQPQDVAVDGDQPTGSARRVRTRADANSTTFASMSAGAPSRFVMCATASATVRPRPKHHQSPPALSRGGVAPKWWHRRCSREGRRRAFGSQPG